MKPVADANRCHLGFPTIQEGEQMGCLKNFFERILNGDITSIKAPWDSEVVYRGVDSMQPIQQDAL